MRSASASAPPYAPRLRITCGAASFYICRVSQVERAAGSEVSETWKGRVVCVRDREATGECSPRMSAASIITTLPLHRGMLPFPDGRHPIPADGIGKRGHGVGAGNPSSLHIRSHSNSGGSSAPRTSSPSISFQSFTPVYMHFRSGSCTRRQDFLHAWHAVERSIPRLGTSFRTVRNAEGCGSSERKRLKEKPAQTMNTTCCTRAYCNHSPKASARTPSSLR